MSEIACSSVSPLINGYLDGELSVPETALLQRHLDFCEQCAVELRELGLVRRALAEWRAVPEPVPVGLPQRLTRAVALEGEFRGRSLRRMVFQRCRGMDRALGVVSLPSGRSLPLSSVIGWGIAVAALLIGIERRHVRRARQLRPS